MELSTLDLNKMSAQELIMVIETLLKLAIYESERVQALENSVLSLEMRMD